MNHTHQTDEEVRDCTLKMGECWRHPYPHHLTRKNKYKNKSIDFSYEETHEEI